MSAPSSPPSLLSRLEVSKIGIDELRLKTEVNDDIWGEICVKLGGKRDSIKFVSDLAFVSAKDVVKTMDTIGDAVQKGRIGLLYDLCREQCGLALAMKTTSPAVGSTSPNVDQGAHCSSTTGQGVKRLKLSSYVDSIDDGTFTLLPVQDFSGRLTRFKELYGEVPVDQTPTREQLSALQSRLAEGDTPYTDFCIWTPGQRKRLREEKVRRWTIDDGFLTKVPSIKTPSLSQWRESFVIFRHAMVILDQGSFADFERYKFVIESLADTFKDHWSVIYHADELMRSSHIAVYKEKNKGISWGACFVKAADDSAFWRLHVDHAVMRLHFASPGGPSKRLDGSSTPRQRPAKDVSQQFCFAYQDGRHSGDKCKDGRLHLCQGCRSQHDLPRGRNRCPRINASKAVVRPKSEVRAQKDSPSPAPPRRA